MITVMYVSVSNLQTAEAASGVADIVKRSLVKNEGLEITGALVFTGTLFAQVLEGPAANVDNLMTSISRDTRHRCVAIVDRKRISSRRFASWQMVYQGVSGYVALPINRLLGKAPQSVMRVYVERIYAIMSEFARD